MVADFRACRARGVGRPTMKTGMILLTLLCGPAALSTEEPPPIDAGSPDAGKRALGEPCAKDNDCASGACFVGTRRSYCSLRCTIATQATDCPIPPTGGICNYQGFCRLP